MKQRCLLTFVLILTSIVCHGYYPSVRNFDKSVNMAGGQNWCMAQNGNGIMWFANTGILEYDGSDWSLTNSLNHTGVRSLLYDEESDRLYIGATNELGYIFIKDDGTQEYVSLLKDSNTIFGEIWGIHKMSGRIWFRAGDSMNAYDFNGISRRHFEGTVTCSATINNRLYISVDGKGIYCLTGANEFEKVTDTEMPAGCNVCSILPDNKGGLLIVTSRNGIFRYINGRTEPQTGEPYKRLKAENIFCAATDGRYYSFGTVSNGVFIYDTEDDRTIHLNTDTGLQNNTILSLFHDMSGNLWLGLDRGIDMVRLSSPEFRMFGNPDNFGAGYASLIYGGKLWLGTNQGLFKMDISDIDRPIQDSMIERAEEPEGQVWELMEYDGKLFCCHDGGIYITDGRHTDRIRMNGAWKLEPLKHTPGYMLGSSYDRLFLLKKNGNSWKFISWIDGVDDASKVFEEDSDGRIWFYHWIKGLFRLTLDVRAGKVSSTEYFSRGNGFPEDWGNVPLDIMGEIVFSTNQGLYRLDRYSGKAFPFGSLNEKLGHPKGSPHVHFTGNGDIFVSNGTMQGIYSKDDFGNETLDTLSLKHLIPKRITGFENILDLSDRSLLINTEDGFSIIRLDCIGNYRHYESSSVMINEIYTRTEREEHLVHSSWYRHSEDFSIHLPYESNSLKLKAVYPKYEEGNNVVYSFRLENYDNWSPWSESGVKEYTRLPHGRYVLRVKATDSFGESTSEDSVSITIDAPWYYSTWAYIAYILLILLATALIFKAIQNAAIARARKITQKKEEEMRHEQTRLDLEHKAADLAESTMNLIRKNEILLEIDADLEKVADYMAEDRNRSLKLVGKIRRDIRENITHDNAWKKFEENFDVVYADFLKRLSSRYPNLTLSDKKMCAYLKMELSSKEIAPLLNITVRSVEMTRYRLRKKLGLGHEANLTEFLQKF